jgi:hypothetical protein
VQLVLRDLLEQLAFKVLQVQLVLQAFKVKLVQQDTRDLLALRAQLALQVL